MGEEMASLIQPRVNGRSIYEYQNEDGALPDMNCGQAAIATLLASSNPSYERSNLVMQIEASWPPDMMLGYLGTSKRRMYDILRAYGHEPKEVVGFAALKTLLERNKLVIVTCQTTFTMFGGISLPSAHWMVAFDYDQDYIYLSNWWDNRMTHKEFLDSWNGWIPWLGNMSLRGIYI